MTERQSNPWDDAHAILAAWQPTPEEADIPLRATVGATVIYPPSDPWVREHSWPANTPYLVAVARNEERRDSDE